jgi:hypothetical protein
MASEKNIERVLDLLTKAPPSTGESLGVGASAHAKAMRRVINDRNVVGVGISEKITQKRKTGKLALTFYVQRKISPKKLRAEMAVPPTVPESLSGSEAIPCDVIVLGKVVPEANVTRHPVQPGFSIGHVDITAGTLGAVVSKGGDLFLLSNSHVLAVSGTAKKGDDIVYPGIADKGTKPNDLVAKLTDFKKFVSGGDFVNQVDCAIAKPIADRLSDVVSEIKGVGVPRGTIKPVRGMKVVKVGRTSGKTSGEVRDVHFRFTLDYEEVGEVGFIDQVLCTRYTKPGDSGSLVIDKETGKAVGLHFAGANGGSVFNPIADVLEALGVTLVTKSISEARPKPPKSKAPKPSKKVPRR